MQHAPSHEGSIWGFCILVFDSSGKPVAHPGISDSCARYGSGTESEVGRTTSYEEGADATVNAPLDHESIMGYFFALGEI